MTLTTVLLGLLYKSEHKIYYLSYHMNSCWVFSFSTWLFEAQFLNGFIVDRDILNYLKQWYFYIVIIKLVQKIKG